MLTRTQPTRMTGHGCVHAPNQAEFSCTRARGGDLTVNCQNTRILVFNKRNSRDFLLTQMRVTFTLFHTMWSESPTGF